MSGDKKKPKKTTAGAGRDWVAGTQIAPGVCFACGCTDEWGCDVGCGWTDPLRTMCSECERRARAFLAWSKIPTMAKARAAAAGRTGTGRKAVR